LEKFPEVPMPSIWPHVGNAMTHELRARELLDFALPLMKAVAADPLATKSLKEWSGYS
jgi:hypothetical protein